MNELFASYDKYLVYKVNGNNGITYYLAIPQENISKYKMFVGFSNKDIKALSKSQIRVDIKDVCDVLYENNDNAIYVLPVIPTEVLEDASLENDNRGYIEILEERIRPITKDVYRVLVEANRGRKKIEPVIHIVKRYDFDKKFAGWLVTRPEMTNYFQEVNFEQLKNSLEEKYVVKINEETIADSKEIPVLDSKEKENVKVRRRKQNNNVSSGFSSFKFITAALVATLFIWIFCVMMIRK